MDLTNASANVTGGAGGFGSATVRRLAERKGCDMQVFWKPSDGLEPSIPPYHGNGFRLISPFSRPPDLPPTATGCDRSAP